MTFLTTIIILQNKIPAFAFPPTPFFFIFNFFFNFLETNFVFEIRCLPLFGNQRLPPLFPYLPTLFPLCLLTRPLCDLHETLRRLSQNPHETLMLPSLTLPLTFTKPWNPNTHFFVCHCYLRARLFLWPSRNPNPHSSVRHCRLRARLFQVCARAS